MNDEINIPNLPKTGNAVFVGPEEVRQRILLWAATLNSNPWIRVYLFEAYGSANSPFYCDIPYNTGSLFNGKEFLQDYIRVFFNYDGTTEIKTRLINIFDSRFRNHFNDNNNWNWETTLNKINEWVKILESNIPELPNELKSQNLQQVNNFVGDGGDKFSEKYHQVGD